MTKIARVRTPQGAVRHAVVEGEGRLRLIDGDLFSDWRLTDSILDLAQVKLLPPIEPPNIIAIGLNYRGHALESGKPLPERPLMFIKATTSLWATGDPILLPAMARNEVDYECELAIVIGKTAHNVPQARAFEYVLGYTCANDVSARDCQLRQDGQWARGKSFDTFAPLGPWIQTEMDPENAHLCTRLNGHVMQDSNTNDLIFSCRYLISFLSRAMTLRPGTVIMTGTPSGVGDARKPPVYLRPGDVVEVEVEGIGVLRNSVAAEPDPGL